MGARKENEIRIICETGSETFNSQNLAVWGLKLLMYDQISVKNYTYSVPPMRKISIYKVYSASCVHVSL
jgi:hypothetical protein